MSVNATSLSARNSRIPAIMPPCKSVAVYNQRKGTCLLAGDIRDFAFFVFERTLSQPRRHLGSHLAMQRLSSDATTSCLNRDAPAPPEHD